MKSGAQLISAKFSSLLIDDFFNMNNVYMQREAKVKKNNGSAFV